MVLRALETEPERRYQTAQEFRTVVEAYADANVSRNERSETEREEGKIPYAHPRFSKMAIAGACLSILALVAVFFAFAMTKIAPGIPLPDGRIPIRPAMVFSYDCSASRYSARAAAR